MDAYNIKEYIDRFNPSNIEFKIIEVYEDNRRYYIVKFLKIVDRLFRSRQEVWSTLCYASAHSHGFDWATKEFTTIENAESEINKITNITKHKEVRHFVKAIR